MALDIGDKRIGVAYSDPFLEYATPSDTYFRTGDLARDASSIADLASGHAYRVRSASQRRRNKKRADGENA